MEGKEMDENGVDPDILNQSIEENVIEQPRDAINTGKENNEKLKIVRLPMFRIKSMMKMDPDCALISSEAIVLVTKATELFIEYLTKESAKYVSAGKRKTMTKRHVDIAIESCSQLCFLDGALEDIEYK